MLQVPAASSRMERHLGWTSDSNHASSLQRKYVVQDFASNFQGSLKTSSKASHATHLPAGGSITVVQARSTCAVCFQLLAPPPKAISVKLQSSTNIKGVSVGLSGAI